MVLSGVLFVQIAPVQKVEIISSSNGQYLNETFDFIDVGNILTFKDGFAFLVQKRFDNENEVMAVDGNFHLTLIKES